MPIPALARGLLLAAVAAGAAGCAHINGRAAAEGAGAANAATSADSLAQTHWELTRWTAPDGTPRAIPRGDNGEPIQLTFLVRDGQYRIHGFSGCNRYVGRYQLQAGELSISAPASTRMACLSPEWGRLEADYLQALGRIQTFTLDSGSTPRHLSFNVRGGDVLEFTRRQDSPAPR